MKQKKQTMKTTLFDLSLAIVQIGLSGLFAWLAKSVLPVKYWLIVLAVLILLACLSLLLMKKKHGRILPKKQVAFRLFSLLCSIVLAVGCLMADKGLDALRKISGGNYQTQVISVLVLDDSAYQYIDDLAGQTLGYITGLDEDNTQQVLDEIQKQKQVDLRTVSYETLFTLQAALMDGETEAILFNEAYRGFMEEINADFESQTRVIYQYHIQEEITKPTSQVAVTREPFSVYISGIDTYGPVSTVSRSDVNMIVTVNPSTKHILMTSIPRDYYVELASFGAYDKLTHAGVYGVEESLATLENLFDIEIDYYARVNFTSLVTMVDALGGITVNNPAAFVSYHTEEYYPAGEIEMDGETALEFARERYGLEGGDRDRVKNQQRVLEAMLKKMMSSTIITNYSSILDAVSGCFETSMSSSDIQALIQMQLNDMASWQIDQISVDGTGSSSTSCYSMPGWSLYVMEPDQATIDAAKAKIKEVETETR